MALLLASGCEEFIKTWNGQSPSLFKYGFLIKRNAEPCVRDLSLRVTDDLTLSSLLIVNSERMKADDKD